jgi:hypothetical protein
VVDDVGLDLEFHPYAEVGEVDIRKILGIQLDRAARLEMKGGFQNDRLSVDQVERQPVAVHVPEVEAVGAEDDAGEFQRLTRLRQIDADERVVVVALDRIVEGDGDGAGAVMRAVEADQERRPAALVEKLVQFALQQIQRDHLVKDTARRRSVDEAAQGDRERRIALMRQLFDADGFSDGVQSVADACHDRSPLSRMVTARRSVSGSVLGLL